MMAMEAAPPSSPSSRNGRYWLAVSAGRPESSSGNGTTPNISAVSEAHIAAVMTGATLAIE